MEDAFWNRQPPLHPSAGLPKRPRPDYNLPRPMAPSGHEMLNYLPRDDDRGGTRVLKDTKTIGSAYDRYLQSAQLSSLGSGEAINFGGGAGLGRGFGVGGMPGLPIGESARVGRSVVGPDLAPNGGGIGFGGQHPVDPMSRPHLEMPPLPPDASNTLFVEGLPPDSTCREVARIHENCCNNNNGFKNFQSTSIYDLDCVRFGCLNFLYHFSRYISSFLGVQRRLVNKESKHHGGDPLVLCFVDFTNPACAATALNALQGYKVDEDELDSPFLRLQFAWYPGPRSGSGPRVKQ